LRTCWANFRDWLLFAHLHNPKFLTPQLLLASQLDGVDVNKSKDLQRVYAPKQKSIPRDSPRIVGTIFVNCCAAVIANARQRFIVQVGEGGCCSSGQSGGIVCNMQTPDILDNWALTELAELERRASEINAHIGVLRQILDESEQRDYDATSSKIIFDSLLLSLSLYGQALHGLRSTNASGAARAA
jgi:hypothetical protein